MTKLTFADLKDITFLLYPDPNAQNVHDIWINKKDKERFKSNWKRFNERDKKNKLTQ